VRVVVEAAGAGAEIGGRGVPGGGDRGGAARGGRGGPRGGLLHAPQPTGGRGGYHVVDQERGRGHVAAPAPSPAVELLSGEVQSRMVLSPAPVGPSSAPPAHAPAAPARSGREEVAVRWFRRWLPLRPKGDCLPLRARRWCAPRGRGTERSAGGSACAPTISSSSSPTRRSITTTYASANLPFNPFLSLSLVILLRFGTASIRIRSVWSAISCGCFVVPS
jgi:hypothetical protein